MAISHTAPVQKFDHLPAWSSALSPFQHSPRRPISAQSTPQHHHAYLPGERPHPARSSDSDDSQPEMPDEYVIRPTSLPGAVSHSLDNLTAYPQGTVIRRDLERHLVELLDRPQFEQFICNTEARYIFRGWMIETSREELGQSSDILPPNVQKLDRFVNESYAAQLADQLKAQSELLLGRSA